MYFIVTKTNNSFKHYTFDNSIEWADLLSKLDGNIIELFQNEVLEVLDFNSYFNERYFKKRKK